MKEYKYVSNAGLAFREEEEMEKLSRYAGDGWILEKITFGGFVFKLKRGEKQDVDYAVDYHWPDDEYFAYFQEAGWKLVYSRYDTNIFSAPKGTPPIYSDYSTIINKYEKEKKIMGKVAFPSLILTTLFILLQVLSKNGLLPDTVGDVGFVLSLIMVLPFVFTGMPFLAYKRKLNKLRKKLG